jgi:hypothetical protein
MPISRFDGSDAPSRSDGNCTTCDRAVPDPSGRHRGRLLWFASTVGRFASGRQRPVDSPLPSDTEEPLDKSALENAGLGPLDRTTSTEPGKNGSGAGPERWEPPDVVTLMVFVVGTLLVATGQLGRNPSPWPELVGMGAIVIALYAQLFRPHSDRSVRFRNAGIIVLLIAVLRVSVRDSLLVFCIRLVLLLALVQAVLLVGRRARGHSRQTS